MRLGCIVLLAGAAVASAASTAPIVSEVVVRGGAAPVPLRTRSGQPYDVANIEKDVRALHATGRFTDVRVKAGPAADGRRVTFELTSVPRLMLRNIETIPDSFPLKPRALRGDAITPSRARGMAQEYRRQLISAGYTKAEVRPELAVVASSTADVRLHVNAGDRVRVRRVRVEGDLEDIGKGALQSLKPRWLRSPAYSTASVDADLARVQSAYVARGYADATVRLDHTETVGGKAVVTMAVRPGRRFAMQKDLCECLHRDREAAESMGVVDFSARASVDDTGVLTATAHPGRSYTVGRIEFEGNRKFSDASIRRNLLLNEAELLNVRLLRKSLDRLNRSGMFEPLSEADVDVRTNEGTGRADLKIRLRERKAGSWLLSGPVGPVSLAGPARFTLASRLPSWGRGLLDLSSYYASLHLSPGQAVIAFQRPFVPAQSWASGFAIAPQLGWRNMAAQYAGTQFRERLLNGHSLAAPPIMVTVQRTDGESLMVCDPPRPRWPWIKRGVSMALQLGSMLAL